MFKLTDIQRSANLLLSGTAQHILLRGGSRSGKTFVIIRAIIIRALMAPGSRHAMLSFRFNRIKTAVILDTFPKVMSLCFPAVTYRLDKVDYYVELQNGSQIFFGGLDDQERTEKVLGKEFASIFLNECSQISYDSVQTVITRLAQRVMVKIDGQPERELRPKMYYDENPPKKTHWSYKLFIRHINPDDGTALKNPENYLEMKLNPADNQENIGTGYIETLNNLSASKRRRFRDGDFADAGQGQLFEEDTIEKYRVIDLDDLPDFVRVVVALDPSGASDDSDNADNDAIGIVVAGLGTDGNAYVLADRTVKAGPSTWGRVACTAYDEFEADVIVAEENYGGGIVRHVIRTVNSRIPYKAVRATRGKVVRAEPISALYEQGKVRHVGNLAPLEEELTGFTTNGYTGDKSPNRADALVWAIYSLFPSLTRKPDEPSHYEPAEPSDPGAGY